MMTNTAVLLIGMSLTSFETRLVNEGYWLMAAWIIAIPDTRPSTMYM